MKVVNISCEPYQFISILSCDIHKTVNQHFEAIVSGYIMDSVEDIAQIAENSDHFILYADEDGDRKSIFRGKVCNLKIRTEGSQKILTLHAASHTCRLDKEKSIRTFQNLTSTYRDIVNCIVEKNEKTSVIYFAGKNETIEGLTVQYDETDWAFLKRLAARLNTVLVPDCTNNSACFYFGIPHKKRMDVIEPEDFEVSVACSHNNSDRNFIEYHIVSREVWELCTPVVIQGVEVLVYDMHGSLVGGEIVWQYYLRRPADFTREEPFNKNIIGASVFGWVTDIKEDMVKLNLECGEDNSEENRIWFPFATIYTSSDGNGWYFMPDPGERVRLCFPDKEEKNAYVISSTYLEDVPGEKNNPEIKFIRTAHGKEIRFTPDSILITNHKGMSILLDDERGIVIKSSENIELNAADGMILSSGGLLKIDSDGGILMNQNENSIIIREGICVNGLRVRLCQ